MDLSRMPIWIAYLLAPVLILLFSAKVILKSDSPVLLGLFGIGAGLICAAVLHAYVFIKRKLTKGDSR